MSREPTSLPALTSMTRRQLPEVPPGWYLFGRTDALRAGPIERTLGGASMVAFLDDNGAPAVLDARCPHMGAHLARGGVCQGQLVCPYHGWSFAPSGAATGDGEERQGVRPWPSVVRHGCLFVFNHREPLFDLPPLSALADDALDLRPPESPAASQTFSFTTSCDWVTFASHAFDVAHFATVHERELLAPPRIEVVAPWARRNTYRARVIGRSFRESLLRWLGGDVVAMAITAIGANLFVLQGQFRTGDGTRASARARSCFVISMNPTGPQSCEATGVVLTELRGPLTPLVLATKRSFTRGYLAEEADELADTRWRFDRTTAADRPVLEYFDWLAAQPGFAPDASRSLPVASAA